MKDERKTKGELIQDLADLRRQVSGLKRRRGRTSDTEEGLTETLDDESLVLDSISEEVIHHDCNMAVIWANRAAAESASLTAEQLVGRMCYEVWHGREQVCEGCPVRKAMDTGAPAESEIITPDGRVYHVHGYPVCEDGGQIVGAVEIVRDITQRRQAERVLRENEARYRAVVEDQTELICRFVPDCTLTFVNEAYCRYFGSTREEMTGINFLPLIPDEDRGAVVEQFASITPDSPLAEHEHRAVLPSGEVRWLHWTNRGIFNEAGRLIEVQAVGRDVTDRRQAEEALRESEARYRTVVEDQTELICRFTPGRRVTFVNDAICRYYGLSRDQILGMDFRPNIHPDDIERVGERLASLSPEQPVETHENRAILSSGEARWLQWTNRGIFDETGRLMEIQAVGRDVTERKRAEEALRRSEENYRVLFEESLDGIVVVADGRVAGANQAFANIHRMDLNDVLGMPITEFMHPDEREAARANIRSVFEGRAESHTGRGRRAKRADGTFALIEVLVNRIDWEGRPAIQAIVRDVTEQTRLEEELRQAQKMEAVGQLAGGIAHDFSNLMTGILCHAALLKVEDPSPEDVREAADLIEGAARRATELTSQLLGFARRGARRDITVDLNPTVETSVRLLSRSLDSRIRVTTRFCDEQAFVHGDPVQMEQVVLNLAMNARDAMPDGGEMTFIIKALDVRPEDCRRRPGAKPGRYVVLSVEDTGRGMSEAIRGRIFEPFFTTKPPGKGTGMGLAMVYGIVKDHGGWVELDSEPGRGTSFRVFLPAAEPAADAEAPRP